MLRHYISSLSGEYIKSQDLENKVGFTTSQPLPEVELADNEYFAMLDADGKVQYWPDDTGCKWQVKTRFGKVTAYHKQTQEAKMFDDVSLVENEYTLEKPLTQWDEWINDAWVTNESNKYIGKYNQVDDARRSAYFQMVTPLIDEAKIKRDLIGTPESIAEAEQLEQQALAARLKIQSENPWPTPPSN